MKASRAIRPLVHLVKASARAAEGGGHLALVDAVELVDLLPKKKKQVGRTRQRGGVEEGRWGESDKGSASSPPPAPRRPDRAARRWRLA